MTEPGYPTLSGDRDRRFEAILTGPSYCTPIAERGGKVLGMVGLHFEGYHESDGSCARIMVLLMFL